MRRESKVLAGLAVAVISALVIIGATHGTVRHRNEPRRSSALPSSAGPAALQSSAKPIAPSVFPSRAASPTSAATSASSSAAAPTPAPAGVALSRQLYVDPNSEAAGWVRSHPDDPRAKSIQDLIADEPTGKWFGAWSGDIASAVAAYTSAAFAAHRVPILVAFNIPDRDCGGQSAGGQSDDAGYDAWINGFANGIAVRPAIVVLEPDALAEIANCLDTAGQQARYQMLAYAVKALRKPGVRVYLDAGHSNWIPADQMAQRLRAANIAEAAGFALNVSNYDPVTQELTYAAAVNRSLGLTKPFIIDSSRNGSSASPGGNWCNPGAQKLGPTPQTTELGGLLLWIKAPGESDGNCGVGAGTAAGQFSPALAEGLITGS